jgi:hypothetical protein
MVPGNLQFLVNSGSSCPIFNRTEDGFLLPPQLWRCLDESVRAFASLARDEENQNRESLRQLRVKGDRSR